MAKLVFFLILVLAFVSNELCSSFNPGSIDDFSELQEEPEEEFMDFSMYESPSKPHGAYLAENFDDPKAFEKYWVLSIAKKNGLDPKNSGYNGRWTVEPLERRARAGDRGLVLKSRATHAAISRRLRRPFHFADQPLVLQYEVNLQHGQECGGAYLKLLTESADLQLDQFSDRTPYTILFGPDKCGNDNKLLFIFRHRNPRTGEYEEKHAGPVTNARLADALKDQATHQYRLLLLPNSTFQMFLDDKVVSSGSLLEDVRPPVRPPRLIDDPQHVKPASWDDRPTVPDPADTKPDDWDEQAPPRIPDPSARRPAGWLEHEPAMVPDPSARLPQSGEEAAGSQWTAPLVPNPRCRDAPGCGPWKAPLVDNPAYRGPWRPTEVANPDYQGPWTPRKIANPDYFEDVDPFKMDPVGAVAFELWSVTDGLYFDNILVTSSLEEARRYGASRRQQPAVEALPDEEPTRLDEFLVYSSQRPWLYGIYVIMIGLPICFMISCCCLPESLDLEAQRKKTDRVSADDPLRAGHQRSETSRRTDTQDIGSSSAASRPGRSPFSSGSPRRRRVRLE